MWLYIKLFIYVNIEVKILTGQSFDHPFRLMRISVGKDQMGDAHTLPATLIVYE